MVTAPLWLKSLPIADQPWSWTKSGKITNDHRSNSHSVPTQVSQANMKFSREGKHFRLSSNNMNKSVSIHSKQRAESNPATSKVTTDAAEVFSNNEVAFFLYTTHDHTIVRGTKENANIYYYMFLQRQPLRPWSLCRCIEDPVSELDHYCWISCDEEYEEMRTERAVTRTEEQRMEFCRETTNDSKEEVRNAWNDGRSRRDPNFAPRK